ncbi:MAG: hypothetical protein J6T67_07235 [Paludibacteraceae bacterium]|nr:hypothetical protein [Paludibacteraceae bacterium]
MDLKLIDKISSLSVNKLEDIVKNYRQYGYSEEIRNYCIELLTERGVSVETPKNQGFLVNHTYEKAVALLNKYDKFSIITIVLYLATYVILPIVSAYIDINLSWLQIISFILFVIFMYTAYNKLSEFFQMADPDESKSYFFNFIILGLIFFVFVYYVYRSKMAESINMIR